MCSMKPELAEEWFERGKRDIDVATMLLEKDDEYLDIALFHIHQAVEKYLKGFLILNGWELKKIHDLETLITETKNHGLNYKEYLDLGRTLTAFYYTGRYPPGPVEEYNIKEAKALFKNAKKIINDIKKAGFRK